MAAPTPHRPAPVVGIRISVAPPPSVPLTFLAAAGVGLTTFGAALAAVASRAATAPTAPTVVAAVHLCLLGFLVTALLGALHQFCPVVGGRPLRSVGLARVTAALWIPAVAGLAAGFATGHPALVSTAGAAALGALILAAFNLSAPLSTPGRGAPVTGLRWAVGFLVATAVFGVVYAFDRHSGWFPLFPHRVLAHAHLGLVGAIGLAYVGVAEKLWPMFLLVPGLLLPVPVVGAGGGVLVAAGLVAHLASLAAFLRHRRRHLELLGAFVLTAAVALVLAVVLGAAAGLAPITPRWRARFVPAEVVALTAWLGLAVIGHVHKIVPFAAYTALRARGVSRHPDGGPLLFTHLSSARAGRVTFAGTVGGFSALLAGVLAASPVLIAMGGATLAGSGILATANLAIGPLRMLRTADAAGCGVVTPGGPPEG